MTIFNGKHIIVGVTGGIAAYKAAELVRLFKKQGARVQVVMTRAATEFVTPLTFQSLSGQAVRQELFDAQAEAGMGHIELARWADLIVVAPATAHCIARIANGFADDLLATLLLASAAPCVIAPAMNQQMWKNSATQDNIARLLQRSFHLVGPDSGAQACGDTGFGRMKEAVDILNYCRKFFSQPLLAHKKVIITAGPTVEDIDPVRYISNRSSGKMGYAIAQAAVDAGAEVTLISGPVTLEVPAHCKLVKVRSAMEMYQEVMAVAATGDIFIATAAVADYRPALTMDNKIKKSADTLTLELIKNKDILAEVAALPVKPFTVGFAAETSNLENYARNKLSNKNLDLIAANLVGMNKGFDQESNELHLFWQNGDKILSYAHKTIIARQLIEVIAAQLVSIHP